MWRRLPTTVALAGLLAAAALYVALWVVAVSRGDTRAISRHDDTPAGFRSNHGPWRHHSVLRGLCGCASIITIVGVLPLAGLGALVERTRRAGIVAALALVMAAVDCAHFPLFD